MVEKVLPLMVAKAMDRYGRVVKLGERGEICISGLPCSKVGGAVRGATMRL
jgi:hypothetical protein